MTRTKKITIWSAGILAGLLVIIVALALLVPTVVGPLQIREKIQKAFAEELGGRIDFETIDIAVFPPRGELSGVRISIPQEHVTGTAASATAYLKILPLFKGDVQIRSVQVKRPDFHVALPEPSTLTEEKGLQSTLQELAGGAYGGLTHLKTAKPDLLISVEDGKLLLTRKGRDPLVFENIQAEVDMDGDELSTKVDAGSNLWGEFHFRSEIDLGPMTGNGRMEVTGLRPHLITNPAAPGDQTMLGDSQVNARVNFRIKGFPNLELEWDVSAPLLTVSRAQKLARMKVDGFRGSFCMGEQSMTLTLTELAMGSPRLRLSGQYAEDRSGPSASVEVIGKDMDVGAIRSILLSVAGEDPDLKDVFDVVQDGKIDHAVATNRGKSRQEALNPEKLDIQGNVTDVVVHIPDIQLEASGITGVVSFSGGILKGEGLQAKTGNTRASQGSIAMGTKGKDKPFHLEIQLVSDVAEVSEFLGRVVEDEGFLRELKKIRKVGGSAQGRLVLGDSLKSIRPRVDIERLNLRGEYERLPHPFEVSEGRLTYEGTLVTWSRLNASVGNTGVSQSAGRVDWGADHIEFAFERGVGDLEQLHPWLPLIEAAEEQLEHIQSIRGKIHFLDSTLKGSLTNPSTWAFQTKGRLESVLLEARFFPASLSVGSAAFEATPEGIRFQNAEARMDDAAMNPLSGSITGYRKGSFQLDLLLNGSIGPRIKKWLYATIGMPPEMEVRAPLMLSGAQLTWGDGVDTSFSGDMIIDNGPKVSLDVVQNGQKNELAIKRLSIASQDSQATISMTIGEKIIEMKFKGDLTDATLRQILEKSTVRNGWVKGEFSTRVVKEELIQSTVQGIIEAGDLAYEFAPGDEVKMRRLSLKASGNSVWFDSADLTIRGTEMRIQGAVGFSPDGLFVNLSVGSESVDWGKISRAAEKKNIPKKERQEKGDQGGETGRGGSGGLFGPIPVNGTVHVRAKSFQFGDFKWEPFSFDLDLKGSRVDLKSTEGRLCDISKEGAANVSPKAMEPNEQSQDKGKEACLLNIRSMSGELDFTGGVAAWGESEDLLRNLQGKFKIEGGEGRIQRYGLISKILAVVNITEIFKGDLPDLTKEGLGYKSALFVGSLENGVVKLEEGAIDARSMGLGFEGSIDLPAESLDITVLVAPLKTVDSIIGHIPLVGGILGKDFIAIPVRATGNWSDPTIIPLSPTAVGSKLLGIVERTLKLPFKLIQPFLGNKEKDKR